MGAYRDTRSIQGGSISKRAFRYHSFLGFGEMEEGARVPTNASGPPATSIGLNLCLVSFRPCPCTAHELFFAATVPLLNGACPRRNLNQIAIIMELNWIGKSAAFVANRYRLPITMKVAFCIEAVEKVPSAIASRKYSTRMMVRRLTWHTSMQFCRKLGSLFR